MDTAAQDKTASRFIPIPTSKRPEISTQAPAQEDKRTDSPNHEEKLWDSTTLYFSQVLPDMSKETLISYFSQFGRVLSLSIKPPEFVPVILMRLLILS